MDRLRGRKRGICGIVLLILISALLTCTPVGAYKSSLAEYQNKEITERLLDIDEHASEIEFSDVKGMVESEETVGIILVLTDFSPDIKKSKLHFHTMLENATWGRSEDRGVREIFRTSSEMILSVDHERMKGKSLTVTLDGRAPNVSIRTDNFTLIDLKQEVEEIYPVIRVWGSITSEEIEEAITAMGTAREDIERTEEAISNATEMGIDTKNAEIKLNLAKHHIEKASMLYVEGKAIECRKEAENASNYANAAKEEVENRIRGKKMLNYCITGVVLVAVIIISVVLFMRRRREPL